MVNVKETETGTFDDVPECPVIHSDNCLDTSLEKYYPLLFLS
jgi:hypothetical protein